MSRTNTHKVCTVCNSCAYDMYQIHTHTDTVSDITWRVCLQSAKGQGSFFFIVDVFAVSKLAKCLICYSPSVLLCEAKALADVALKGSEHRSNQPRNSIRMGLRSSAGPPLHQLKCLSFKHKTWLPDA